MIDLLSTKYRVTTRITDEMVRDDYYPSDWIKEHNIEYISDITCPVGEWTYMFCQESDAILFALRWK